MHQTDIKHLVSVDKASGMPKYLQVSNSLIRAIEKRQFAKGDLLPSIRELSCLLDISFDTAKKAYEVLKKMNIIKASHGKSNVINTSGPLPVYRVFLLFNELSIQKKCFYDSLLQNLPVQTEVDIHVYNNDYLHFCNILSTLNNAYTHYIILPPFNCNDCNTAGLLKKKLAGEQLILLDSRMDDLDIQHTCIYQDFESDIYSAMKDALPLLVRYQVMNFIIPEENFHNAILRGFKKFCIEHDFVVNEWHGVNNNIRINKGELFITLTDEDLVLLFDQLKKRNLEAGKDVGIISYNDTPLKEVLLKGITTISPDFNLMGKLAANTILNNRRETVAVPLLLKLRYSL